MKTRSDFVTNSSSSSFVMGFKNKDTIKTETIKGMPKNGKYRTNTLVKDVTDAEKKTFDETINEIEECVYWQEYYRHVYSSRVPRLRSYGDTEECKAIVKNMTKARLKEIKEKAENDTVFLIVSYSDHTDSDMEHEIMPHHKNTLYVINNH